MMFRLSLLIAALSTFALSSTAFVPSQKNGRFCKSFSFPLREFGLLGSNIVVCFENDTAV